MSSDIAWLKDMDVFEFALVPGSKRVTFSRSGSPVSGAFSGD